LRVQGKLKVSDPKFEGKKSGARMYLDIPVDTISAHVATSTAEQRHKPCSTWLSIQVRV
jgi:hypothetical protein